MIVRQLVLYSVAVGALFGLTQMARSADVAEPGGIEIQVILPAGQRCLALGGPVKTVIAVTQIQDWCDPGNRDLLQVDVFVKLANGSKGSYQFSYTNISCSSSSVPQSAHDYLCP